MKFNKTNTVLNEKAEYDVYTFVLTFDYDELQYDDNINVEKLLAKYEIPEFYDDFTFTIRKHTDQYDDTYVNIDVFYYVDANTEKQEVIENKVMNEIFTIIKANYF